MPNYSAVPTEDELSRKARAYVRENMRSAGGLRQALAGFRLKTFPLILGLETRPRTRSIAAVLIRFWLLVGAALTPALARKIADPRLIGTAKDDVLFAAIAHIDRTDVILALLIVALNLGLRFLDVAGKENTSTDKPHPPFHDLCAAIDKMPPIAQLSHQERRATPPPDDSIRLVLQGLRTELTHLIGDDQNKQLVDVTLLEYCDPTGRQMQVRARTAAHEPTHRPRFSYLFMANFIAKEGRWFVEHDFLNKRNPFPPYRLTVLGNHKIDYRSVLFLPIYYSITAVCNEGAGDPNVEVKQTKDQCLGVICVHSSKAFRFWRWGDQEKEMGGFGNVAYQRSLPYISVVRRLLEHSPNKVALEA